MIESNKIRAQAKADFMEREAHAKCPQLKLSAESYLDEFASTRSADPDSRRRDLKVINCFKDILGEQKTKPLTVVSRKHVLEFKERYQNEVEPSTFNSELSTLNVAFERAVDRGLMPCNPVDLSKDHLFEISKNIKSLELWEVGALLHATQRLDWRTCIYTGFYTGCQLVDAAYRLWTDLINDNAGRSWLILPENERRGAKRVFVHPILLEHYNSLPRVNEYICPTVAELERWTADNHFMKITEAAKLDNKVTFRCLRHTFSRLTGVPIKRLDTIEPDQIMTLPDIRVPLLPCQIPSTQS